MKRLRWKLIRGAMFSFLILLLLIDSGIVLYSYSQMEQETTLFLDTMLDSETDFVQRRPPPMFGYESEERHFPAGFFDVLLDDSGGILSYESYGIPDPDAFDLSGSVQDILLSGGTRGKLGIYKYGIAFRDDGSARLLLIDNTVQVQSLYSVVRGSVLVSVLALLLLFVILQPIASRAARSYLNAEERQKQFVTNASHELKTPVAVIQANVDAMELLTGENKWSRNIRGQVSRLNHLIEQQLLLARMDEQSFLSRQTTVDLSAIAAASAESYTEWMRSRQLLLQSSIASGARVKGSAEALEHLTQILLENAAKYALSGSTVHFSLSEGKRCVILSCENQVSSLPQCQPDALFERFYRGGIARREGDMGCGIGLSTAQSIVENHHGRIHVAYPDDHTFRIAAELPLS